MKTIFDACIPRPEVLAGELREDLFAARLRDVTEGRADPVYQDPATFFENTFPTEGLRRLLEDALGRLTGAGTGTNAVLRLETGFGGGKTHNLIALYHAAQGYVPPDRVVHPSLVPVRGASGIAAVSGADLDPANGIDHGSGFRTRTLWGEIAWQLGGADGVHRVAESERTLTAPGTEVLEQLVGDRPTLIMIDEIARHLRAAKSLATANGRSDLAEQTIAFILSLSEFAASREHVVVVLTLADSADAFGQESDAFKAALAQSLGEARRVLARQERVLTPTAENEIASVVTYRLFRKVDRDAARDVAAAYADALRHLVDQGADVPQHAARAEYAADLEATYPFHPELLLTLNRRVSTIPNFQRTRGALRLLALVVRDLWQSRPADTYLIHPQHISLSDSAVANDLTSRLERPRFLQVIESDIVSVKIGQPAHAQQIDEELGSPIPYTRWAATTVFLNSLVQGAAAGVDKLNLALAVVRPGDDPAIFLKQIDRLIDRGWYIEYDGSRYRFKTEASLNKIVNDEMGMIQRSSAKAELEGRIRQIWKKGEFDPIFFPAEPGDVPDDAASPKLVVMGFEAAIVKGGSEAPPNLVRQIVEHAGSQQSFRTYRNNLVFLVADEQKVDGMVNAARRHLAIQRILNDTQRMGEFYPEQRDKLKNMGREGELQVRIAITSAFQHLFYPSAEGHVGDEYLTHRKLTAQQQGQVDKDQTPVVLAALRDEGKAITAESPVLSANQVKSKVFGVQRTDMTTEDLRRAFAQKHTLGILFDVNQLKRIIENGIKQDVWVYYEPRERLGFGRTSRLPLIQIDDDHHLYLVEAYRALGWPLDGEAPPPPPSPPVPPDEPPGSGGGQPPPPEPPPLPPLTGSGPPLQAMSQLRDACLDRKAARLASITVHLTGDGREGAEEVRAVGLAIPQTGASRIVMRQQIAVEFEGGSASLEFTGAWERYKRIKGAVDALAGDEHTSFYAVTDFTLHFSGGLDVHSDHFAAIASVFDQLKLGYLVINGEAAGGT